jgi:polyhydroxybutyrate depolymerase
VAANLSRVQSEKPFPKNPVPVIFINGTHDPLVPYDGGYVTVFKQKRGKVLSVEKSLEAWRRINNCSVKASEKVIPDISTGDKCNAVKTEWVNPENQNIKVVEIKVKNGGHTWPGTRQYLPRKLIGNTNRDFNGCDEIWSFFNSLM